MMLRNLFERLVSRRYEVLGLALYAFILILRAPWVLFQGQFWAEEGTFCLQYGLAHVFLRPALEATSRALANRPGSASGPLAQRLEVHPAAQTRGGRWRF